MRGYALDTNIISFILRKDKKLQEKVYREANEGSKIVIPAIAFYEIKRGLIEANATTKLRDFERLCDYIGVEDMDVATLDKAAVIWSALKKAGRLIEDSDILIAASCLTHDYMLVTDNIRHFERVEGLPFINWI